VIVTTKSCLHISQYKAISIKAWNFDLPSSYHKAKACAYPQSYIYAKPFTQMGIRLSSIVFGPPLEPQVLLVSKDGYN